MRSPVDQFESPAEYFMRIVFLFVYYIDELPLSLTTRDLLLFLQEHVVGDQELQKFFYLKIHGLRLSYVEFDGFIRGFPSIYVDRTPELDKEVFKLNEAEIPDDAELEALIEEANCNGCELVRLVQYSGIIPGDVERSEEMLDDEEWEKKKKKERKRKKKARKSTLDYLDLSDSDLSEPKEKQKKKKHHSKHKKHHSKSIKYKEI